MIKTIIKNITTCILIAAVLSSCVSFAAPASHKNLNILNGLCGNLCWNGIIVGTTTKEDLLFKLKNLPGVDPASIVESKVDGVFEESVYFSFYVDVKNKKDNVLATAYLINQKVAVLNLYKNLGINLQDVIMTFGNPSIISTDKDHSGNVNIFFTSDKGSSYSCQVDDESVFLSPDLEIQILEIFDVSLYQELLTSEWLMPRYNSGVKLYKWSGYKKIDGNYWPPR